MSGISQLSQLQYLVRDSLFEIGGGYVPLPDGELRFDGDRPGPSWNAHGYFSCKIWMLDDGRASKRRLWKRRWLLAGTTQTRHSRPPDVLPGIRFCTLIVSLKLWAWLDAKVGLHNYAEFRPELQDCGSRRSLQRWLRKLLPSAMDIQQAIRLAVIKRCEPRPLERIFPGGLDPPLRVDRKRWQDGSLVGSLWTALAMLFGTSSDMKLHVATLLAEARRRCEGTENNSM